MSAQILVDIRVLSVRFEPVAAPAVQAVKDLTITLMKGEFTVFAGESGSGKSVTALSIGGLVPAGKREGSIRWNGEGGPVDLHLLNEERMRAWRGRRIAYVFQDPSSAFSPVERIGPQIQRVRAAHFPENADALKEKALEALRAVSFTDPERVFKAYPHELSGGMRQRAAIAFALAAEPELLIADEPTTALDPVTENEILNLLQSLRRERGLSVLLITHDLAGAARFADRVYILRKGAREEAMVRDAQGIRAVTRYGKALFAASGALGEPKSLLEVPRAF